MIYITENKAINFRHQTIQHPFLKKNVGYEFLDCRSTTCEIVTVNGNEIVDVVTSGVAICHPSDNFNKEIGRKTSLQRAVEKLHREERVQIWNAYFAR